MTFLAPGFFFASLAVAAAIVALHFIVTRQPRSAILPTARFVPDTRATAVARARRPSDLLLMLLRVLLVLAAGAGLAKPVLKPSRGAEARVILVDVSRSARDSIALRDSVRAFYRNGDAMVVFDSSARLVSENVTDTIEALKPTSRRGNLSAALIAALRAGSSLRDRADSLELVVVSPFAREELDAATDSIRMLWRGKARLVRVGQPAADTGIATGNLEISADASEPLTVTVALARKRETGSGQRATGSGQRATENGLIDRRSIQTPRSVTSSPGGGPLIEWPASSRPRFAVQRAARDTVGGVMAGEAIVVSAFGRTWSFPPDSLRGAEVIARWVDGDPAAIEKPDGAGCVRSVAVPVSPVGDFVIRNDFVRFVASLSRPCSQRTSLAPADPNAIARLERKGGLAPREAFQPLTDVRSELAPWLFALALAAAIAELFVRNRRSNTKALAEKRPSTREARAA
jgi:hypothetical protein